MRTRVGAKFHSTAEQTDLAGLNVMRKERASNRLLFVRLQVHAPAMDLRKREAR